MEIFTYVDYLKYDNILNKNNKYILMEDEEKYSFNKKETKYINNKHDKTFRKILDNKKELIIFLNKILKLKNKIKENEVEKYNSSFISIDFRNQESDIVYKIKNKEIYILIEHQTKIDYLMPIRILQYEIEIIRKENKKNKNNNILYPIVIPIVLYTGRKQWDASIKLPTLKTEFNKYKGIKDIRYNLVDINNYEFQELLKEESILSKIMIIEKSKTNKELKENIEKIINEILNKNNKYNDTQKNLLFNIIEYTLNNILSENEIKKYKEKLEGEKNMLAVFEMIEEEKQNSYISGKKEGITKGKKERKKESIKQIAKKMIKMKIDKNIIINVTGLDEKEIEQIEKQK